MSKPTWWNTLGCSAMSAFFWITHASVRETGDRFRTQRE